MDSASAIARTKRRQAIQVILFLVGVAAATTGGFFFVRADLVAYRRGEDALARQDFATAAAQLGEAWRRGYRAAPLRLDLARARLASADRAGALPLYEEALAAAPRDESLLDTVAGLYQAAQQPDRALALYARFAHPEELSPRALIRLGDLKQQTGDFAGAVEAYQLAAARLPQEPQLQLRLGIVLSWLGRRTDALAALRRAVALAPDLRAAHLELARVLMWDGRFADAVTEFRTVLPP